MPRDEDQARSWVVGELMLAHPDWTPERAEKLYEGAMEKMWGQGQTLGSGHLAALQQAQAQPNAPTPTVLTISAVISDFEAVYNRVAAMAEHSHMIADKLTGTVPPPPTRAGMEKGPEPVGAVTRLYALRAMIDLELDLLNEAMRRIDQAV